VIDKEPPMTDHEPMPTKDDRSQPVQDTALQKFIETFSSQWQRGKEKYGTDLMTFNGRSALNDALQELADLLAYVVQMGMELEYYKAKDEEKVCGLPDDISARLRRAPVMPSEEVTLDIPERRWEIHEHRPDGSVYVTYGDKFIDAITEAWRNCKVT